MIAIMNFSKRLFFQFLCLSTAVAIVSLAGCRSISTSSEQSVADEQLVGRATYSWLEPPIELRKHQVLDRRTDLLRESRRLVNQEMTAKGYQQVAQGKGQMRLMVHLATANEMSDQSINSSYNEKLASELEAGGFRIASGLEGTGRQRVYRKGTLVVDVIDDNSPTLLWRGSAQARIDTGNAAMEDGFPRLSSAIRKILRGFPDRVN